MRPLGRRFLFALPLVAPVAVAGVAAKPTPNQPARLECLSFMDAVLLLSQSPEAVLIECENEASRAMTIGIDVQRDGIVISAMAVRA